MDTGWRRNKYGGWFNIFNYEGKKNINTTDYMNKFIRGEPYTLDTIKEEKTKEQAELEQTITDIVNNGQVFDFSVGPTMTIISRYENGNYGTLMSDEDEPMGFFESHIVPHLSDQFVVIDDGVNKKGRASRFKKYGYEIAGEIEARKKNFLEGTYENVPYEVSNPDKWILMRKKK